MPASKTPKNSDEAALRDLGLSFPEATEEFPWDHRALKVKGKVFVFMGTGKDGGADHDDFFISCKLPQSAPIALTIPGVKPTGYGLGKAGWVSAQWPPGEAPLDMLCDWLRESYCAIAPKKLAALLEEGGAAVEKGAATRGASAPKRATSAGAKKSGTAKKKKSAAKKKKSAAKKKKSAAKKKR
ncbi:MAG: MmcQ/YjbR family DNA-binding protein [Labilithrix sp.]|nr:MmcQ/YjbR family DNA-binding protein [Labilithrix sp.]